MVGMDSWAEGLVSLLYLKIKPYYITGYRPPVRKAHLHLYPLLLITKSMLDPVCQCILDLMCSNLVAKSTMWDLVKIFVKIDTTLPASIFTVISTNKSNLIDEAAFPMHKPC